MMRWRPYILWKRNRLEDRANTAWKLTDQLQRMLYEKLYVLKRDRLERELFHSCVILKNLAIIHQELPMSADFMLEQLMDSGRPLRSIYADILTLYRRGEKEAAFRTMPERIQTKAAQDFARILGKLDSIHPSELVIQMNGFEETFAAERKTKAMARAERKSLITTLTSTVTVFVVLLNFTVVVIFLDTLRIIEQLF